MAKLTQEIITDIVEWDIVNWKHALLFWDNHLQKETKSLNCLELGGRRGGPSLWLALNNHTVLCSDYENPKEIATQLHKKYLIQKPITYQAVDGLNIPFDNNFDIIVFKSILGGISRSGKSENKKKVIDECSKALVSGGKLYFSENLEASWLHKFARKKFIKWGGDWNYLKYSEVNDLFSSFSSVEFKTHGFFGAFGRSEKQRSFLGKIDSLLMPIIPSSKRYIVYGIATK